MKTKPPRWIYARPMGASKDWKDINSGPWSVDKCHGTGEMYIHRDAYLEVERESWRYWKLRNSIRLWLKISAVFIITFLFITIGTVVAYADDMIQISNDELCIKAEILAPEFNPHNKERKNFTYNGVPVTLRILSSFSDKNAKKEYFCRKMVEDKQ